MIMDKDKKFTKYITIGFWLTFIFFVSQAVIISMFNLCATPIVGLIAFASFVILTFSPNYNKNYEFSPYKGLNKIFGKNNKNKKTGEQ
jgi:hypothetical protein